MRSLLDVNTEIAVLVEECTSGSGLKPAQISRKKNRIEYLKTIKAYLETGPKITYIDLEIEKLENRIALLSNSFDRSQYKDPKEAFKKYEKEMGIPELRKQVRTLRFIKN
jgi:hypothetical protein